MSKVSASTELYQSSYDFYKENAKLAKDRTDAYTIPQSAYGSFMNKNGITNEILSRINEIETAMVSAADTFTTDKLEESIIACKAAGEDPGEAKIVMRMATGPKNKVVFTLSALKNFPNIVEGGTIVRHGVFNYKIARAGVEDMVIRDANVARIAHLM